LCGDYQSQEAAERAPWIQWRRHDRSVEGFEAPGSQEEIRSQWVVLSCQRPQFTEETMAKIDVLNLGGEKVGSFALAEEVFGAVNQELLWEAVKHYRAGQRAGTHATKNKKLVSGAGRKLWRQKGTGRARVGSIRSPLWRHGGTVHGPQPRSYDYAFPRKKLLGALRSALAAKLADGKLVVVENFELSEAKTKAFRQVLDKLNAKST